MILDRECANPECTNTFQVRRVTDKYCASCGGPGKHVKRESTAPKQFQVRCPGKSNRTAHWFTPIVAGTDDEWSCHHCSPINVVTFAPFRPKWDKGIAIPGVGTITGFGNFNLRKHDHSKPLGHDPLNDLYIGIDGEGTDESGEHKYVVLGYGDKQLINAAGIQWHEAFAFLWDRFKENPDALTAGYYLGYDFTQLLSTMPEDRARQVYDSKAIAARERKAEKLPPFPAEARAPDGTIWQYDLLPPQRRLKIRLRTCRDETCMQVHRSACPHMTNDPWMWICDAGPFFQASLLSVIDPDEWPNVSVPDIDPASYPVDDESTSHGPVMTMPYITKVVTPEEYETIKEGKSNRDSAKLGSEMCFYNRLENEVLARLLSVLDQAFQLMGIHLNRTQWFGPGQAAQEWLNNISAILREQCEKNLPAGFRNACREAYYGGWFELMAHGHIAGNVWEYDINSAYPHQIAKLPCLVRNHFKLTHSLNNKNMPARANNRWILARVITRSSNLRMGGLPYRKKNGNVLHPRCTQGVYWLSEIDTARRAGLIDEVTYVEWWCFEQTCDCVNPLDQITGLYQLRLEAGKDTPLGKAAKLVYNSAYGKFCQSVGFPKYGNAMYASLITSGCRSQILDAIATHPDGSSAVLMVATDAVYFLSPHPDLTPSKNLGEWDSKIKHNLTLMKPGIYWDDTSRARITEGKAPKLKSRGVSAKAYARKIRDIDEIFSKWSQDSPPSEAEFPHLELSVDFALISPRQALARRKWHLAGKVLHNESRDENAWSLEKRNMHHMTCVTVPDLDEKGEDTGEKRHVWFSETWDYRKEDPSTPYDKMFGDEDGPLWDSIRKDDLYTDDGPVMQGFKELFGTG